MSRHAFAFLLLAACSSATSESPPLTTSGDSGAAGASGQGPSGASGSSRGAEAGSGGAAGAVGQAGQVAGEGGASGSPAGQGGSGPVSGASGSSGKGGPVPGGEGGSAGKVPTFCEPGAVSPCLCQDGASGVAQCNANGSVLGPCVCQPKPPSCSKIAGGCPDKRDFYDCPSGATLPVSGCLQYAGMSAFYCCGDPAPASCDPARVPGKTLAAGKVTKGPEERWTLPALSPAWLSNGEAKSETSPFVGVGVGSSPIEVGSVEVCIGFVCSNGTVGAKDCIGGDKVAREGVQMCCVANDRHAGGKLPQTTLTCDHGSTVVRIENKTATCRDLTVTIVH